MKVICVDNYGRDYIPDRLIQEGLTEEQAKKLADEKNEKADAWGPFFYQAVPDDYVLNTGEP